MYVRMYYIRNDCQLPLGTNYTEIKLLVMSNLYHVGQRTFTYTSIATTLALFLEHVELHNYVKSKVRVRTEGPDLYILR